MKMPRPQRKENAISILIVDDTDAIVYLLARFLDDVADEIEVASDGAQAVKLVVDAAESGKPYDVVLMDLQMPNMSGMEALRAIRQRGIQVPLIAMTASRLGAKDCEDAGFDGYVTKPFDRKKLVTFIREFIT